MRPPAWAACNSTQLFCLPWQLSTAVPFSGVFSAAFRLVSPLGALPLCSGLTVVRELFPELTLPVPLPYRLSSRLPRVYWVHMPCCRDVSSPSRSLPCPLQCVCLCPLHRLSLSYCCHCPLPAPPGGGGPSSNEVSLAPPPPAPCAEFVESGAHFRCLCSSTYHPRDCSVSLVGSGLFYTELVYLLCSPVWHTVGASSVRFPGGVHRHSVPRKPRLSPPVGYTSSPLPSRYSKERLG